jgi:uncharacterized repeat protein (TIGR01451 family)
LDKSRLEGHVRPLARLAKAPRPETGVTGGFGKALAFCLALVMTQTVFAATPVGTVIPNTASLSYQIGANPVQTLQTNTVQTKVVAYTTPSTARWFIYAPGLAGASPALVGPTSCSVGGGPFTTLPAPKVSGKTLNVANPQPLASAGVFHAGDAAFIEVQDKDADADAAVRDTVVVTITVAATGDSERVRLTETGVNTGVFAGYIQTVKDGAKTHDCELSVKENAEVAVSYVDANDPSDTSSDQAPVDPFEVVFDSTSGKRLDGVTITLVDADTGKPAQVMGYDGVSRYPATVVSGSSVTDGSGKRYRFDPGTFRFPLVKPGHYRMKVEPPTGYLSPSTASEAQLQALTGAPYTINPGSYEKDFTVTGTAPTQADIPLDPAGATLFVQKAASTQVAAIGDFVQFTVTVGNNGKTAVTGAELVDTLPQGMRYAKGSANLDGVRVGDPAISADGRQLTFPVGGIKAGASAVLKYVVEITAASQAGAAVNSVQGFVAGRAASNVGTAQVQIQDDMMSAVNTLVGRVIVDDCDGKPGAPGLENVRVFMETGTYGVTDKDGRFHFQGVSNGTHVVQLDTATLPEGYEMGDCVHNTRFAGRNYSQFVELHGGALWRVDFHVHKVAPPTGTVSLQLFQISAGDGVSQQNSADLRIATVPAKNLRVMIIPPEGVSYETGSAALDGVSIADPDLTGGALQFHLGDVGADWHGVVTFRTRSEGKVTAGLETKGIATFDTDTGKNQRTPAVSVGLPAAAIGRSHEVLTIEGFQPGHASLTANDLRTMKYLGTLLAKGGNVTIDVIGFTDNQPLAPNDKYKDNLELSRARAQLVADYIRKRFDLGGMQLRVDGHGDANPCESNDTAEGRAKNRRTEIDVGYDAASIEGLPSRVASSKSDVGMADTQGAAAASPAASLADKLLAPQGEIKEDVQVDKSWFAGNDASAAWVLPADGYMPISPAIKVAVRHAPDQQVRLSVNGTPVDRANFQGAQYNTVKTLAISQWLGVAVKEGDNLLAADVVDQGGNVVAHLEKKVHFSGVPARAEFLADKSVLVADGKTKPVLAIKLYDRWGYPVRAGMVGRYNLQSPYQAYQSVAELQQEQLSAIAPRMPGYMVREDGTAYIVLAPTNTTGQLTLELPLGETQQVQELRAWMQPAARDWILVGLANGTAAFNTIKGHMETGSGTDPNDDVFEDGRVAFYAKGSVKGEFLITAAYDSAKQTGGDVNGLKQTIDPNQYFMLYGDASQQSNDAVSASKLYVKIERNQFYAMFGDYNTGLTVTELSRYDRVLNGLKSEYNGEHLAYSAFAAQNSQSFVKDEIQGNGTSGLYHLSHQQIILDSETITLEVHDRFQPDRIVKTQTLTRYLDYNLDYVGGTIFFKQPVPSRDSSFNPVFIVAQYEVDHGGDQQVTGGGRVAAKFADGKVEVGTTLIDEATGTAQGSNKLAGADLRVDITQTVQFRAEVSRTDTVATNLGTGLTVAPGGVGLTSNPATAGGTGNAYLAELKTHGDKLESDLYVRSEDAGFGLGQQSLAETATHKVGADAKYHITERLSLLGEAYRSESLDGGGTQNVADAGIKYENGNDSATAGLRHATQEYTALSALPSIGNNAVQTGQLSNGVTGTTPITAGNYSTNQAYVGGSKGVLDNKVTLHAETDVDVGSQGDNPQYPAATTVGADWRVTNDSTLFANEQLVDGSGQAYNRMTEIGVRSSPWEQAQVQTSVASQQTEYGPRNFSTMGLTQGFKVTDSLSLNVGVDRVQTMSQPTAPATPVINPNAAPSTGTTAEDFTSMFVGASYHKETWSLTTRAETMHSDSEKHRGLFAGFYKDLAGGDAFSLSLQGFDDRFDNGAVTTSSDLRFGLAHRPDDSRWTVLNQMDFVYADQQGVIGGITTPQEALNQGQTSVSGLNPTAAPAPALDQRTWKFINNLQLNYKYSERSQLSFYYGSKYVLFDFDANGYKGYTDLVGVEYRYDIKPKWDVGFLANRMHSWSSNVYSRSFGVETGWLLATNMWVSVGYNFTGFYDQDFTANHYTAKGLFVRFRFKFDQDTIKDLARHGTPAP